MFRWRFRVVLLVFVVAWGLLLASRGLWAPDEARYARVTQEMAQEGRWVIPRLNGELYTQKPPLFYDMARLAALAGPGGVPEWAVKVPSLVAAAVVLLLVGLLGVRLMGPEGLWSAPLALAMTLKFGWQAQFGQIDMVLTALVTAQILVGLRLSAGEGSRRAGLCLLTALGAAGLLTKGPVGFLLPWMVLAAYLSARKDWAGLRRTGLPWAGAGILAATVLWLAWAGLQEGWDYPRGLVMRQSVQRYVDPWGHKAPFTYYLTILIPDAFPLSLPFLALLPWFLRKRAWREPGLLLPLAWLAVYLVFFSISPGKRSVYILPAYPAMALAVAYGLFNVRMGRWGGASLRWTGYGGALIAAAGVAASPVTLPGEFKALAPWIMAGAAFLALGLAAFGFLAGRSRTRGALAALAAGSLAFLLVAGLPVVRALDATKTPYEIVQRARPFLARGGRLGVYPTLVPSVNYYLDAVTPVFTRTEKAEAEAFLAPGSPNLLLVEAKRWEEPDPARQRVVFRCALGEDEMLLLSAAGPEPAPEEPPGPLQGR